MESALHNKMVLSFNTRRGYSAAGQRIAATTYPNERVLFVDIDRGIAGVSIGKCDMTPMAVMDMYDHGEYVCFPYESRDVREALEFMARRVYRLSDKK